MKDVALVIRVSKEVYEDTLKKAVWNERDKRVIRQAIKAGTPLDSVLDEIRAEIDKESAKAFKCPNWERAKALEWAMAIIDKYRAESKIGRVNENTILLHGGE